MKDPTQFSLFYALNLESGGGIIQGVSMRWGERWWFRGELGGEEESCGCMCIELENMPQDTSNILGTLWLPPHFLGGLL